LIKEFDLEGFPMNHKFDISMRIEEHPILMPIIGAHSMRMIRRKPLGSITML